MNSTTEQTERTVKLEAAHPRQIKPANPARPLFRTFRGGWGDIRAQYVGTCPVSGVRLYFATNPDDSNDPRGPLGHHAVTEFVAREYNMKGPTLLCSWIACNNDRAQYERALKLARSEWVAI